MSASEDSNRPHTSMVEWMQHHVITQASRKCLKQLVGANMRKLQDSDRHAVNVCIERVVLCAGIGIKLMQDDSGDQ